jgi:spore coat protein H
MSFTASRRPCALSSLAATLLAACSDAGGSFLPSDAAPPGSEPVLAADAGRPSGATLDAQAPLARDAATPSGAYAPAPPVEPDSDPDTVPAEPALDLFDPTKLLEVQITLPAEEFAALSREGRSLNAVFSGCEEPGFAYSERRAAAQIAGRSFAAVGLRKKGFLGSLSVNKPSLRVVLDAFDEDAELAGSTDLTLNNTQQDPSFTHQCMAYALFNAAGIPAPRCNFAHVVVNGKDLGVYTNVESVKKPFLKARFGNAKGDLYEGAMADFRTDMLRGFEKKTHEDRPISPLFGELASALTQPDDALLAALPSLIDVDEFLRFWAMESLLGHWDGYAGDLNNFFVYIDPADNKMVFLPWGADAAFSSTHSLLPAGSTTPASVLAWARLPGRLYANATMRKRYHDTLRSLVAAHWDEAALLAEVNRISALLGSAASSPALDRMRTFVQGRRAAVLAELDAAEPRKWPVPERATAVCKPELTSAISGTFDTQWGQLDDVTHIFGNALFANLAGVPVPADLLASAAGNGTTPSGRTSYKGVRLIAVNLDTSLTVLQFVVGNPTLGPGVVPLHGLETFGVLLTGPSFDKLSPAGVVGDGQLVFERAAMEPGAPVKGRFDAKLTSMAAAPAGAL